MKRFTDIIWWLVVSIVLILVTLLIAIKMLLPYVDNYRPQIERNLSQISGYQIQIKKISAKLEGLDPSFSISGVSLSVEDETQPLYFERLMIRFNFWESVIKREPKFSYIRFYNTRVSLSEISGQWSLTGLPIVASSGAGGFARILNYFLDQRQISLLDTQLEIKSERIGRFDLLSNAVYLQRTAKGIGLTANVHHHDYEDEIKVVAEMQGNLNEPESLRLDVELDLPQMSISPLELTDLRELKLAQLELGAKLWLSYSKDTEFSLLGNVNFKSEFDNGDLIDLRSDVRSHYSSINQVLSAQLSNLIIEEEEITYPVSNLKLESDLNKQEIDLRFDQVDLALATKLSAPYMNKSWFVTDLLQAMQAKGLAQNGHLSIHKVPSLSIAYEGNLAIESSQGFRNIPSIEGMDALLKINNAEGSIAFASNQAKLAFPLMYKEVWLLDGVSGEVNWRPQQDAFLVSADSLYMSRNGADLSGDFRLEVVKDYNDTLALDIHADNLEAKDGLAYIPLSVLPETADDWLAQGVIAGNAQSADFVIQTELVKGATPQYLVDLNVQNADVKFAPDWPVAKQLNAKVLIDPKGIDIDIAEATLENVKAQNLDLNIPFYKDGLAPLQLSGRVQDDMADVMALLSQTSLAKSVLQPFQSWQAKGKGDAEFRLILPLTKEQDEDVYLNLALKLVDTDLVIRDLNLQGKVKAGRFNYDSIKGIYDSHFDIEAFSGRSRLALFGKPLPDGNLAISADIDGDLDLKEIMSWQKLPLLLSDSIQGHVNFDASFSLDASQAGVVSILANTDLVGASLSFPSPFSKTKNLVKPLAMSIDLVPNQVDVTIDYDQSLRTKLRFVDSEFYGGQALINDPETKNFSFSSGLVLQGQLQHVELAAWRKLFNSPSQVETPQSLRLSVPKWLSFVHLIADQVRLDEDNLLHNAKVEYDRLEAANDMLFSSEEIALKLSKDLQGPVVNFSYLSWNSPVENNEDGEVLTEAANSSSIRAQQIPSMTLNIDELVINDKPYGDWRFMITNLGKRLRIDPVSTELENGDFNGSLFWQDDEHSNVELSLVIDGENMDELTRKFSPESLLTSKTYKIDVNLSWLGTPFDIKRETLTGRINFAANNGVIEKINELPSFLKALGVFNIHALARRLTLDFSDVSSEGLTYDTVSALLSIQDGQLTTLEPLRVISPAVEIELKGSADLVTETLDENLVASFPLGNTLPIAGLLLGMPQVAGLLYITDKIFGSQLAKVTSVEYMIKGSFSDPIITPVIHTPNKNVKGRDK